MAVPVQNQMEQVFEQLGRTLNDLANIRGSAVPEQEFLGAEQDRVLWLLARFEPVRNRI